MNTDRFLEQYERIADATDAIGRLRSLILDLAVRGKLVPQDPLDEAAALLLLKLAAEKSRLISAVLIRDLNVDALDANDAPFPLPDNWIWTRLGTIGDWGSGSTPLRTDSHLYGGTITWLKSGELNDNRYLAGSQETITELALNAGSFRLNRPGDVLIAMYGATIGKVAILAEDAVTNQAVCGCTPFSGIVNHFLFFFLLSQREMFRAASEGGAQPNISKVKIIWTPFPLPPLAEQQRIVAKVDELMALCDELEAKRAEREATRDRFTAASYARLNVLDPDPIAFAAQARFALHSLNVLTTRPDQIKQLRQTILNLAVRGKLVPQDPNDEAASELLKRILASKERLVATGKAKRIREPVSFDSKHAQGATSLPQRWICTRLGIVYDVRDGTHDTPKYVERGYPLITSKNLSSGNLSLDDVKLISEADHRAISERSRVDKGDVLLAMIGSIGNPVIVNTDKPFSIKNVALFKYFDCDSSCPTFLRYFLQHAANQMKDLATGGLQPFVSLGFLRAYPIDFPPLAEQRRIVAKVDELMALCDQLEQSLATGEDTCRRLLDALIADTLKPADHADVQETSLDQEPSFVRL